MLLQGAGLLLLSLRVPILAGFDLFDSEGQVFVACQKFAEFDESSHDQDAHLHSAAAIENSGQHGGAVFGEGIGRPADPHLRPWIGGHNL